MSTELRLGFSVGMWRHGVPAGFEVWLREAETLGVDSMWAPEAWGNDALTPLAYAAAKTSRLKLGTAVAQLSARPPSGAAMAAATLDHLSGGRFTLGLGVSGPQVVEGWYGRPFASPLARTRDYVGIVRRALERDAALESDSVHYPLPFPGGTGLGRPMKLLMHPRRAGLPIYIGAEGPNNIALAGEIADGWIANYFSPSRDAEYRELLLQGRRRGGRNESLDDFPVACTLRIRVNDDLEAELQTERERHARVIGAMGAADANFHADAAARLGFEGAVAKIQRLWGEKRYAEAAQSVPDALLDEVALIGPVEKIRDELSRWRDSVVTTLICRPEGTHDLRRIAEAVLG